MIRKAKAVWRMKFEVIVIPVADVDRSKAPPAFPSPSSPS